LPVLERRGCHGIARIASRQREGGRKTVSDTTHPALKMLGQKPIGAERIERREERIDASQLFHAFIESTERGKTDRIEAFPAHPCRP
jgi:hypothetical protein